MAGVFILMFFSGEKVFIFNKVQVTTFSFMVHAFSVLSRKSLLKPRSQELLYRFYNFKYKIIEGFIIHFIIYIQLIIEYSETEGLQFIFSHLDMHHFLERLSFPY